MRTYYIYKATNLINGKCYIGQALSFRERVWEHLRLSPREDCNFHDAIREFGKNNFDWEILETVNSHDEALERERYYIEYYDTYHNGYNMNKGGVGGHNARSIVQLTKNGDYLERYDSAAEVERKTGFHNSDVLNCCKNNFKQCMGFVFMFEDDYNKHGFRGYEKQKPKGMKKIVQCDLEGNLINRFDSVQNASRETGIGRSTISGVLTGIYKSAGGFIWVYEKDFPIKDISIYKVRPARARKVAQINPKTGETVATYDQIKKAGNALGVNYKSIHKVIDKPNRTAYGFKWISIS